MGWDIGIVYVIVENLVLLRWAIYDQVTQRHVGVIRWKIELSMGYINPQYIPTGRKCAKDAMQKIWGMRKNIGVVEFLYVLSGRVLIISIPT